MFRRGLNVLESWHYGLEFEHKFLILSKNTRELSSFEFGPSSCTRNSEYNYVQMEGFKNGCLRFFSRIWCKNIRHIPWQQSTQNQDLGKKYFGGKICYIQIFVQKQRYCIPVKFLGKPPGGIFKQILTIFFPANDFSICFFDHYICYL